MLNLDKPEVYKLPIERKHNVQGQKKPGFCETNKPPSRESNKKLFKEAEHARLRKFQADRDNLNKEYEDIQRNIKETKDYISKRKDALKQETASKIKALSAQRAVYYRRSPYTGKIVAVHQKSANVFEITIERDLS